MIIVTGASRGIGKWIADWLDTRLQDCIIPVSRTIDLEKGYRVDVSDQESVRCFFRALDENDELGEVTGLINCAGIASMNAFLTTPVETLDKLYQVNVRGTFLMSQYAAKRMIRSERGGCIINFSSVAVPMQLEGELAYVASKGAIESMSKVMARELAPYNITVNVLAPQPTRTDLIANVPTWKVDAIVNRTVAKQYGNPDTILQAIEWLLMGGIQITGQTIYIGGV